MLRLLHHGFTRHPAIFSPGLENKRFCISKTPGPALYSWHIVVLVIQANKAKNRLDSL
jgi:hypothetical protein